MHLCRFAFQNSYLALVAFLIYDFRPAISTFTRVLKSPLVNNAISFILPPQQMVLNTDETVTGIKHNNTRVVVVIIILASMLVICGGLFLIFLNREVDRKEREKIKAYISLAGVLDTSQGRHVKGGKRSKHAKESFGESKGKTLKKSVAKDVVGTT